MVTSEQNNSGTECSKTDDRDPSIEQVASVQTRAMVEKEKQPVKPLKVTTISGLDIGPEELKEKQRSDTTLKKYWDLISKPESKGKPQFVEKKDILYRKYSDTKIQLVVPTEMREKLHTRLAGHRGAVLRYSSVVVNRQAIIGG